MLYGVQQWNYQSVKDVVGFISIIFLLPEEEQHCIANTHTHTHAFPIQFVRAFLCVLTVFAHSTFSLAMVSVQRPYFIGPNVLEGAKAMFKALFHSQMSK